MSPDSTLARAATDRARLRSGPGCREDQQRGHGRADSQQMKPLHPGIARASNFMAQIMRALACRANRG
jgi:hypothetical protein